MFRTWTEHSLRMKPAHDQEPAGDVRRTHAPPTELRDLTVHVQTDNRTLQLGTSERYTLTVDHATGRSYVKADTVYGALRGVNAFAQLVRSVQQRASAGALVVAAPTPQQPTLPPTTHAIVGLPYSQSSPICMPSCTSAQSIYCPRTNHARKRAHTRACTRTRTHAHHHRHDHNNHPALFRAQLRPAAQSPRHSSLPVGDQRLPEVPPPRPFGGHWEALPASGYVAQCRGCHGGGVSQHAALAHVRRAQTSK